MADNTYQAKAYQKQGGSEWVIASGGTFTMEPGSSFNAGNLAIGNIPLGGHLMNARQLASGEAFASGTSAEAFFWGGVLTNKTTPALSLVSTANQSFYLSYASGVVDGIKLPPISLPSDVATAAGVVVELYGESVGTGTASDAISAIQIKAFSGVAGTNVGSTHPNFTSSPSWQGVTIASGSIVTSAPLNITLVPQAHAGRGINLYDARIRYTRSPG